MKDVPSPSREELIRLRNSGMTRDEIAEYYGVAMSRVKRWIKELDVPTSSAINQRPHKIPHIEGVPVDDGLTLIEKARNVLGKRMSSDYRGYLLDGRPVRVDFLISAAGLKLPDVP